MIDGKRPDGLRNLVSGIDKVLVGKEDAVVRTVAALIAGGHLLIEDVPGIGKTLLGLALAKSIDASFRRIQFTNDLLPSDITGLTIYDQESRRFEFQAGPIFSNVVLADEINRSTPKTQSALLEAMNERQVSVDGKSHVLEEPFFVIATENPVEYHGTFPLPEAQLDRFLMRVQIGYPSAQDERDILKGGGLSERLESVEPCLSCADVLSLQRAVASVHVDDALLNYIVAIAARTREAKEAKLGMSPRASQALRQAAQAFAVLSGRDYCVPDDVKRAAVPVIAHRLVLDTVQYGLARVAESEAFVERVMSEVPAPQ